MEIVKIPIEQIKVNCKCEVCEKKIFKYPSQRGKRSFCSKECMGKWRKEFYKGEKNPIWNSVKTKCKKCRGIFNKQPSTPNRKFCSQKCLWEYGNVITNCGHCGKEINKFRSRVERQANNFCSKECLKQWQSNNRRGKDNPSWLGGHSKYRGENWSEQRKRARIRDIYQCQKCRISQEDNRRQLDVHHIIPFRVFGDYKEANKLSNLITLCHKCHGGEESKARELYGKNENNIQETIQSETVGQESAETLC